MITTRLRRKLTSLLITGILLFPITPAFAESYITLETFSGTAAELRVSGGGWTPGETVSIYLNTTSGSPVTTATADANSFFGPIAVPVPLNTPQGHFPVIAVGSISQEQKSNSFYIVSFTPSITVTGNSAPGSTITINGQGFAPNEPVTFLLNGNTIGQANADGTGAFVGANATVPFVNSGTYVIHATGQNTKANAVEYFYVGGFFPSVLPSTYYLLPTQTLNFSGTGFAPGETIHIFEGQSQSPLGSIVADGNGSFTEAGNVIIPVNATGAKTYRLYGLTSKGSASVEVTIGGFNPLVTPSSHYLLPDQTITFSGSGFSGNEVVRVFEGQSTSELAQLQTDAEGNFTDAGGVRIPFSWTNSSRTFRLVGHLSGAEGSVMVTIGQFDSLVSPSSHHITPGERVTFTGSGFAPNEAVYVSDSPNGKVLSMIFLDATGGFTDDGGITIPFNWANTAKTFHFEGQSSHTIATVMITVAPFAPQVSPSEYYLMPGSPIFFSGSGFGMNEEIDITQANGPRMATTTADATGAFEQTGTFTIPFDWLGKQTLLFTGIMSKATAETDITIAGFMPQMELSTYYAMPGEEIFVSGSGFAPDELITVSMNGASTTITANPNGEFLTANAFIAPLSGTTLHFEAIGEHSNTLVQTDITLAPLYPMIAPDTWYLPSGGTIHFSGSGFGANEVVTAKKGIAILGTVQTDGTGSFENFTVVTEFGNTREVVYSFTGNESGASVSAPITVAGLQPYIALDNYYVLPGTSITVTGAGFSPNESVSITLGTANGVGSADSNGMLTETTLTVPFGLAGPGAEVTATGQTSGAVSITSLTLAPFAPYVSPSAWYTPMGSLVTFTATGFAPNETVDITMNGASAGTVTADATGAFASSPMPIPYAADLATFTFTGTQSGGTQVIPISIAQLYPGLELSIYYAMGGTPITVTGVGYAANEQITLTFDGQAFGTTLADMNGNFIFNSTVPYRPAGEKTVTATGNLSGATLSVPFTQPPIYSASAQLGSYAGAPGSAVTFVGSGFIPGETINIITDRTGSTVVHTFTVDASGNFNNSGYIIPADFTEGPITFTIDGMWSFTSTNITYYVTGM